MTQDIKKNILEGIKNGVGSGHFSNEAFEELMSRDVKLSRYENVAHIELIAESIEIVSKELTPLSVSDSNSKYSLTKLDRFDNVKTKKIYFLGLSIEIRNTLSAPKYNNISCAAYWCDIQGSDDNAKKWIDEAYKLFSSNETIKKNKAILNPLVTPVVFPWDCVQNSIDGLDEDSRESFLAGDIPGMTVVVE